MGSVNHSMSYESQDALNTDVEVLKKNGYRQSSRTWLDDFEYRIEQPQEVDSSTDTAEEAIYTLDWRHPEKNAMGCHWPDCRKSA